MKELMFVKINNCSDRDVDEIYRISKTFYVTVIDYSPATVLIESVQTKNRNNDLIALLEKCYANRIEIVRGGSVAIETLSIAEHKNEYSVIICGQTIIFTNGEFAVGEYIAGCEFFNMLLQFYFSRIGIHISL